MKFAHVDNNGQILGWYDQEIHQSIPEPNVQVAEDIWQHAIDSSHNTIIDGVTSQVDHRSDDQKAEDARFFRNELLVREVDPIVTNPLRWGAMTAGEQRMWTDYRQSLLDIPQQPGFPSSISWPSKP
jgi:hypothetical protein